MDSVCQVRTWCFIEGQWMPGCKGYSTKQQTGLNLIHTILKCFWVYKMPWKWTSECEVYSIWKSNSEIYFLEFGPPHCLDNEAVPVTHCGDDDDDDYDYVNDNDSDDLDNNDH